MQSHSPSPYSCTKCGSTETVSIKCPASSPHYAQRKCAGCKKWIAWERKPSATDLLIEREQTIDNLMTCPDLNDWERSFLLGIKEYRHLTPNQQEKLNVIESKVNESGSVY